MNNQKKRLASPALVAAITVLLLAGCSGADPASRPTITKQQAVARVAQILQATGAAVTPRPRLEIYKQGTYTGACAEEANGASDARVQATSRYFLKGIPQQQEASVAEQILRLWKAKGYTIDDTFKMGTNSAEIHAVTKDSFLIALEMTGGVPSIVASSPCVWPDGTPPPQQ